MEADQDTASTEVATTSTTTNSEEPLSKNARKRLLKMEQKDEIIRQIHLHIALGVARHLAVSS